MEEKTMFENTYNDTVKSIKSNTSSLEDKAEAMLLSAIDGLLTKKPYGDDRTYAMIPEVTGGDLYRVCASNIRALAELAGNSWDMHNSDIEIFSGVNVSSKKLSELGVIFENLRAYEAKIHQCKQFIIRPNFLVAWDIFSILPENERKIAVFKLCSDIYLRFPNAESEANIDGSDNYVQKVPIN